MKTKRASELLFHLYNCDTGALLLGLWMGKSESLSASHQRRAAPKGSKCAANVGY
jgi:hypothetical protein